MKYSISERSWVDKFCIVEFLYEFSLLLHQDFGYECEGYQPLYLSFRSYYYEVYKM